LSKTQPLCQFELFPYRAQNTLLREFYKK